MYLLKEIEKYTNGKIVNGNPETKLKEYSLLQDNQQAGDFFIPILFRDVNREKFIINAVKAGAIGFMISKNSQQYDTIIQEAKKINPEICIVEVEDVNESLYQLGLESRRRNINKPIIAVTGSVGKTTLCSLIAKVLETQIKVLHDVKNQNNNTKWHISHTLMYFENYDMAVIELGISDVGIMTQLSKLVEPSIAIVNSIDAQHLDNLKTRENILQEKLHITDFIKEKEILFVNMDNSYLQTVKESSSYELRKYSSKETYDIQEEDGKLSFKTKIYGKETEFCLNLYGRHHLSNIVLAIKIGEIYHINYENIVKAINQFQPVDGRLKVIENTERNITIIDDAYNFSIEAAKLGLKTANNIKSKRKIAVLGEMTALGEQTQSLHEELGEFFKQVNFDCLYMVGEYTKYIAGKAKIALKEENIKIFKSVEELISTLDQDITEGDLIYIKASNAQHFSEVVNRLKFTKRGIDA